MHLAKKVPAFFLFFAFVFYVNALESLFITANTVCCVKVISSPDTCVSPSYSDAQE